jgi:23S rRNA pseudouridine2605 synthase
MNDETKKPSRGGPRRPNERGPGGRDGSARKGGNAKPGAKPFRKRTEAGAGPAGRFEPPRRERDGGRPATSETPLGKKGEAGAGERGGPRRGQRAQAGSGAGKSSFRSGARGNKPFDKRPGNAGPEAGERIAKRLARAGISSRRDAEALIAAGRVKVNGQVLSSPAFNVRREDRIELDDTEIPPIERTRLFLFHKPAGIVTTSRDPEGRKTVFDVLPKELPRLMTIGRLDINTEGLLLLTNDGGLARILELPATGWLRRYRVRVHGKVDEKALADLKNGIAIEGIFYGSIEASLDRVQGSNAWLTVGLREGKNREVKNILGALGLEVTRLIRVSYGPFQLGELPEGAVQELKGRMLRDQLGERLMEEAGANFDAPVAQPFSNKPVRHERGEQDEATARPARDGNRLPRSTGAPNRKRERDRKRDDALERLQTKPGRIGKPGEREPRRDQPVRSRASNVWMAPGARPVGRNTGASSNIGKAASKSGAVPSSGASRHLLSDGKKRTASPTANSSPDRGEVGPAKRKPGQGTEGQYRFRRDESHRDDKPPARGKGPGGTNKPRRGR